MRKKSVSNTVLTGRSKRTFGMKVKILVSHECKFCLYAHQKLFLGVTCLLYLFLAWARSHPILQRYGHVDLDLREVDITLIIIARINLIAISIDWRPNDLSCRIKLYEDDFIPIVG